MHRFTSALLAALGLSLALTSLGFAQQPDRADGIDQDLVLDLYMSTDEGGEISRSFISGTSQVHAVLEYQNARGQQYQLRVADLSGINVFSQQTPLLNGEGSWSTVISVTDFIETYQSHLATGETSLGEDVSMLAQKCQDIPEVPEVWPPSEPNPTDDYSNWLKEVFDHLEGARSATLELTRTLQSMGAMPDIAEDEALSMGLSAARQSLANAETLLDESKPKLRPETGRPDPQGGCDLIGQAATGFEAASSAVESAMDALPEDFSSWRLPTVEGRYNGDDEFVGCQQYSTDIIQLVNGQPADSPTKSMAWGVGDTGEPHLIFPGPEEADSSSVGRLDVMYVGGAEAMYAQTVLVEGLNREAMISAYVTDRNCLAIDGTSLSFAVDPSEAGSVEPAMAELDEGMATVSLTSGDVAARARVNAVYGEGAGMITGRGDFSVIGPASMVEFKGLRRNKLNRAALQDRDRRISLSVFATDANNEPVATGTQMVVEIINDPNDIATPGILAYDRVQLSTGVREVVELGKRAELLSSQGFSVVHPCEPGYRCDNLYLMAGDEADGRLRLRATVDGETAEAQVEIVTEPQIFLPFLSMRFDVYAPPTYVTIPPEEPTPGAVELERASSRVGGSKGR